MFKNDMRNSTEEKRIQKKYIFCLHWKELFNKMATQPLFLYILALLKKKRVGKGRG